MAIANKTPQKNPFVLFPLKYRSKNPACRFKAREVFNIPDGCENRGVRLDRMLVIDIDVGRLPDGVTLQGVVETLRGMGVPVDDCPRVRSGSGGEHIYLALPQEPPKLAPKLLPYVDIKAGRGAYVVAPGSVHPNGQKYERLNDVKLADAPTVPRKLMRMLGRPAADPEGTTPGLLNSDQLEIVLKGLNVEEYQDHDRWLEVMMACRHACPEGEVEFVAWSTSDPLYADRGHEIAGRWHSVDPEVEGGITTATLYQHLIEAKTFGPDNLAPRHALAVMDFAALEDEEESEPANEAMARQRSLSIAELLALPQPEWLLERAMPVGSLAVLYGPPKSAKTFLALDLAFSVAAGRHKMHGLRCRSGKVLYVLAEGGAPMMGDRAKAWLASQGLCDAELRVLPRAVNLSSQTAVDELIATEGSDWDLVVFDTLARCMNGDENTVKDMSAAIKGCDFVRQSTGGAVLLVHHAGKDQSKGMRGSTALLGAVDSVMRMRATGPVGTFEFKVQELRHGEPAEPRVLRLQPNGDSAVLVDATDAFSDFGPKATVLDLATTLSDGAPRRALHDLLIEETGVSAATAKRHISEYLPLDRSNAVEAIDGRLVWRERDEASGPKAEVIRHS